MGNAPALTQGLSILERLANARAAERLEHFFEGAEMSESSIKRLAAILVQAGYLERLPRRGGYRPGTRLRRMVQACAQNWPAGMGLETEIERAAEELGISVQYGILDRHERRIVVLMARETEASVHVVGLGMDLTPRCHRHALAKAILAFADTATRRRLLAQSDNRKMTPRTILPGPKLDRHLNTVRKTGVAVDREELASGIHRAALPVFDGSGEIQGAVCATWFSRSAPEREIRRISRRLRSVVEAC